MVVIAIGSRLRQDDAIGVLVAEHIGPDLVQAGIRVVIAETDVAFGMAALEQEDHVALLDACCTGKEPGELTVLPLQETEQADSVLLSQHEQSLIGVLNGLPTVQGCFIGIEVAEIDFGLGLSLALRSQFHAICEKVKQTLIGEQWNQSLPTKARPIRCSESTLPSPRRGL